MMRTNELFPGMKLGSLTLIEKSSAAKWHCVCDCGNQSYPTAYNLIKGYTRSCGNCGKNSYRDMLHGQVEVTSTNGYRFVIDKEDEQLAQAYKWHVTRDKRGTLTVLSSDGIYLHRLILHAPVGSEVDHIDMNRLNNCKSNLRIVTHQQNQINQPLQKNNTSGVSGVRYYPPRKKYSARLKISQHEIHLGYYLKFVEAVQARNVGMMCMYGEYGRYNDVPEAPDWIRKKVINQCKRFVGLSLNKAFLLAS